MSKHTPEPWIWIGTDEDKTLTSPTANYVIIAGTCSNDDGTVGLYINQANADRIVACVNALAGIDDPAAFVEAAKAVVEQYESAGSLGNVLTALANAAKVKP